MSPERSTTGGDFGSWAWLPPPVPSGEGSLFYPPFETSANGGDTVAIGGDALYVSRNNVTTWTASRSRRAARSSALYDPEHRHGPRRHHRTAQCLRTTWNGAAWGALTALATPRAGAYVSDLLVDPEQRQPHLGDLDHAVGGGRVFRSDDGGASWTDCSAGLPDLAGNAVESTPGTRNRVWVALDLGVYQSLERRRELGRLLGRAAERLRRRPRLPSARAGAARRHAQPRRLGNPGRRLDDRTRSAACSGTGRSARTRRQRWFTLSWPATWHMRLDGDADHHPAGRRTVTWNVQVERASAEFVTYWITVTNLTGTAVTFEGRYCILSRY